MRTILLLALSLMPSLAFAADAAPPVCAAPAAMSDGWPVAPPAQVGLDPKLICSIGPSLEGLHGADPDGVVVIRHGTLVYEHYFTDEMHYDADTVHPIHSVTKSVVGLLVGIAFDRDWLKRLDDPVFPYFPRDADLQSLQKDRITLQDLLTMTSGLEWPESTVPDADPSNIFWQMQRASDPYRFVLTQPLAATPGTVWNYNSGGVELLGDILAKVSHQKLEAFARQALFDPLGIKHFAWLPSNGKPAASWGLWLRPRDLAKIGQLLLNHGNWNGQQIVSTQWINEMVAPHVPRPSWWPSGADEAISYGYLWWLGHLATRDRTVHWIAGIGWGGQRLYVVPSLDLVIVVTASVETSGAPQYLAGSTALDLVVRAAIDHAHPG